MVVSVAVACGLALSTFVACDGSESEREAEMETEDSVKGRSEVRGGKVLGYDPGGARPGGGCALQGRGGLSQRKGRPSSMLPLPQSRPSRPQLLPIPSSSWPGPTQSGRRAIVCSLQGPRDDTSVHQKWRLPGSLRGGPAPLG